MRDEGRIGAHLHRLIDHDRLGKILAAACVHFWMGSRRLRTRCARSGWMLAPIALRLSGPMVGLSTTERIMGTLACVGSSPHGSDSVVNFDNLHRLSAQCDAGFRRGRMVQPGMDAAGRVGLLIAGAA